MIYPKISIITPSFNQGRFIEETIQSVLSQGYSNLEYIIMDGGSTDNTLSVLKKYEGKLRWFSKKDKGQSDAINKGLKMAKGDIVAWINSDDYYLPGTLNKVAEIFTQQKETQWIAGDYQIINEQGKEIQSFVRTYKRFFAELSSFSTLSILNFINQPSTFWRKELMYKAGYLNESYRYCMDYDLWMRFIRIAPPHIEPTPLSAFRIHSASKGGSEYTKQFEEELAVLQKHNGNKGAYFFHALHNKLITLAYSVMK